MKTTTKIAIAAVLVGTGYAVAKYESPIKDVSQGLYSKAAVPVENTMRRFYNWATDRPSIQDSSTNGISNIIKSDSVKYQSNNTPVSVDTVVGGN
ncbi:MAG: hypothetical protein ACMXYG_04495 [Candidatus Woesearchaeota archaeon]